LNYAKASLSLFLSIRKNNESYFKTNTHIRMLINAKNAGAIKPYLQAFV
jgi:hypothetical protein